MPKNKQDREYEIENMRRKGEEVERKEEGKRKKKRERAIEEEVIKRVQKKEERGKERKERKYKKEKRAGRKKWRKNWRIQRGILECDELNNNRFLEGIGRVGCNNTFGNMNG